MSSENNLINISSSDHLENLIKNNNYLILDFYSPSCIPCKKIKPFIETMAEKNKTDLIFGLINVYEDDNFEIKEKYEIKKFPSLVFIKDGNVVEKYTGYDIDVIEKLVNKHKSIKIDEDF